MSQVHLPPKTMEAMQHVLEEASRWRNHWKRKYKSEVPSLKKELQRLRKQLKEIQDGDRKAFDD